MALILTDEQQMLKESAKGFLAEHAPVKEVRNQRDADSETGYDRNLWPKMVEMGWGNSSSRRVRWSGIWECGNGANHGGNWTNSHGISASFKCCYFSIFN